MNQPLILIVEDDKAQSDRGHAGYPGLPLSNGGNRRTGAAGSDAASTGYRTAGSWPAGWRRSKYHPPDPDLVVNADHRDQCPQ